MTSVDDRAWAGQATQTRKGRRKAASSQTLGLRLDDIYLLSTTPKGIAAVGGLSLLVDGGGITVVAPSAAPARTMAWNQTTSLSFRQGAEMPDGRRGTILELVVGPRTVRFLVPTDRVAPDRAPAFEAHLIALALSVGVDLSPSAPPKTPPAPAAAPVPAPTPAATPAPAPPKAVEPPPAPVVAAPPPPPPAPVVAALPPPPAPVVKAPRPPARPPVAAAPSPPPAPVVKAPPPPAPPPAPVTTPTASAPVAPEAVEIPAPVAGATEVPVMGPYAAPKTDVTGPAPLPPPVPAYPTSGRNGSGKAAAALERARKFNDGIAVSAGPGRRHRRGMVTVMVVALLVCCLAAGAWYTVSRFAQPAVDNAANLRADASGINIQLADVPVNWQLDTSAASGQSLPFPDSAVKQNLAPATEAFARCVNAPVSGVEQIVNGGPPPGGVIENSAMFSGASATVSSAASIFPTAAAVDSELTVVSLPQFPACEQQLLMAVLKTSLPAGVTVAAGGAATAAALPAVSGVQGTIVDTPVQLIRLGGTQTVFLESAYVTSGRVASAIYADSPGQPLDPTLFDDFVKIVAGRTQVVAGQVASPGQTPAAIGAE